MKNVEADEMVLPSNGGHPLILIMCLGLKYHLKFPSDVGLQGFQAFNLKLVWHRSST